MSVLSGLSARFQGAHNPLLLFGQLEMKSGNLPALNRLRGYSPLMQARPRLRVAAKENVLQLRERFTLSPTGRSTRAVTQY